MTGFGWVGTNSNNSNNNSKSNDNSKGNRRFFDCASRDDSARGFAQDDNFYEESIFAKVNCFQLICQSVQSAAYAI